MLAPSGFVSLKSQSRRPFSAAVGRVVRFSASLALLVLLASGILRRGPVHLRPPQTVLSNSPSHPFASEPYLLFLSELKRALPEGARIVVISDDPNPLTLAYFVALSQLPRQTLLPKTSLRSQSAPRFVAVFRGEFRDPRYGRVRVLSGGALYEHQ